MVGVTTVGGGWCLVQLIILGEIILGEAGGPLQYSANTSMLNIDIDLAIFIEIIFRK